MGVLIGSGKITLTDWRLDSVPVILPELIAVVYGAVLVKRQLALYHFCADFLNYDVLDTLW
jgi:hypothetical protein